MKILILLKKSKFFFHIEKIIISFSNKLNRFSHAKIPEKSPMDFKIRPKSQVQLDEIKKRKMAHNKEHKIFKKLKDLKQKGKNSLSIKAEI